jgi:RimJ/RimL family protein N-acetyltransferase
MIRLTPVQITDESHQQYLWQLLGERKLSESISHRKMPTYQEHVQFVRNSPNEYEWWFIIEDSPTSESGVRDGFAVGAIYLTYRSEIGVQIALKHRREGYAKEAIERLIAMTSIIKNRQDPFARTQYLANINPDNGASIALFTELGFQTVQMTLRKELP